MKLAYIIRNTFFLIYQSQRSFIVEHYTYVLSVFVHIVSAIVWIGGMAFISFVLVPVLRRSENSDMFSRIFRAAGMRFRTVGWISLFLLVASGISMLGLRGYTMADLWSGYLFQGAFGHTLLNKIIIVLVILLISLIHDFWIGPKSSQLARLDPGSAEYRKFRVTASWMGRINFLLAIVVVLLGIFLVRGV